MGVEDEKNPFSYSRTASPTAPTHAHGFGTFVTLYALEGGWNRVSRFCMCNYNNDRRFTELCAFRFSLPPFPAPLAQDVFLNVYVFALSTPRSAARNFTSHSHAQHFRLQLFSRISTFSSVVDFSNFDFRFQLVNFSGCRPARKKLHSPRLYHNTARIG
jgi:hypothetical protein